MHKEIQLTNNGNIVTVISIKDNTLTETLIAFKVEYSCDFGTYKSAEKIDTYVILDKSEIKEFCVTQNYLVVILGNSVKVI
jgi:hypothetical protein